MPCPGFICKTCICSYGSRGDDDSPLPGISIPGSQSSSIFSQENLTPSTPTSDEEETARSDFVLHEGRRPEYTQLPSFLRSEALYWDAFGARQRAEHHLRLYNKYTAQAAMYEAIEKIGSERPITGPQDNDRKSSN